VSELPREHYGPAYGACVNRSEHEALIRAQLAEAAQALQLCGTGLRGMFIDKDGHLEPSVPAIWPDYALDGDELWYAAWSGLLPGAKTRIRATNAQITALDKILPMFFKIKDIRHRQAVWLRAAWPRAGWRRIGHALGCSHMTARAWEKMGIEAICMAIGSK
jgi:hypothetical protein